MDKILIIEDEELIREDLKTLLSNAGYLVEAAEEFGNVAELVRALAPDLILLDVNLPGRDGKGADGRLPGYWLLFLFLWLQSCFS